MIRNLSDKNAQLQKQLENVIREGEQVPFISLEFGSEGYVDSKWGAGYFERQASW